MLSIVFGIMTGLMLILIIEKSQQSYEKTKYKNPPAPKVVATVADATKKSNDTAAIVIDQSKLELENTVKKLFLDYYKAGYMDGSGRVIDLHNENRLTQAAFEKWRQKDWRKIEDKVNSKSILTINGRK